MWAQKIVTLPCEKDNSDVVETIRTLFWDNYFTGIRKKCYYFNTLFTKPNGPPSKGNPYNKQLRCYLLNSCFVVNFKGEQDWTNCAYLITDQRKLSLFKRSPQLLLDPSRSCKFGHIVWSAKDFQSYFPAGPIRHHWKLAYCFKTKQCRICWKRKNNMLDTVTV